MHAFKAFQKTSNCTCAACDGKQLAHDTMRLLVEKSQQSDVKTKFALCVWNTARDNYEHAVRFMKGDVVIQKKSQLDLAQTHANDCKTAFASANDAMEAFLPALEDAFKRSCAQANR